jgi:hypothetical protein
MRSTGKVRTLRGTVTTQGGKASKQLILNDQLINRGLKVTGFFIWPQTASYLQNQTFNAILSYAELANSNIQMDAGDNTQIGWCSQVQRAQVQLTPPPGQFDLPFTSTGFSKEGLIDPDHIINRDLFISFRNSDDRTFNYMVVCEFMELTDDEAIVTIIKENSQSIE